MTDLLVNPQTYEDLEQDRRSLCLTIASIQERIMLEEAWIAAKGPRPWGPKKTPRRKRHRNKRSRWKATRARAR